MSFLLSIERDSISNCYIAFFSDGESIQLNANTYHDAVLEADMLDVENYEKGYN